MKVLVVDDDAAVADVVAGLLEDLGCTVECYSTIPRAFARLDSGPLPDLILSDVRMPGPLSGIDFVRMVKAAYPDLAIVLMSGYPGQADAGETVLLTKPITQHNLEKLLLGLRSVSADLLR